MMNELNVIEREIENMVEEALKNSKTYLEALRYVNRHMPFNEFGTLLKKTIQDKIKRKALDSPIRL